mgnify:CR=1 FL=1
MKLKIFIFVLSIFTSNLTYSKEYLIGLKSLPIPNNKFPDFNSISPIIERATGWTLTPVAGFLDEELFFELNKNQHIFLAEMCRSNC